MRTGRAASAAVCLSQTGLRSIFKAKAARTERLTRCDCQPSLARRYLPHARSARLNLILLVLSIALSPRSKTRRAEVVITGKRRRGRGLRLPLRARVRIGRIKRKVRTRQKVTASCRARRPRQRSIRCSKATSASTGAASPSGLLRRHKAKRGEAV